MKQRIKELAVEAGFKTFAGPDIWAADDEGRVDTELNKFAELILEDVMQELFINGHTDAFDCLNEYLGVE